MNRDRAEKIRDKIYNRLVCLYPNISINSKTNFINGNPLIEICNNEKIFSFDKRSNEDVYNVIMKYKTSVLDFQSGKVYSSSKYSEKEFDEDELAYQQKTYEILVETYEKQEYESIEDEIADYTNDGNSTYRYFKTGNTITIKRTKDVLVSSEVEEFQFQYVYINGVEHIIYTDDDCDEVLAIPVPNKVKILENIDGTSRLYFEK